MTRTPLSLRTRFARVRLPAVRLLLATLVCGVSAAQAADWDVGPGRTFASPAQIDWSRIRAGDTIRIQPGTYAGSGHSMSLRGVQGAPGAPVQIVAANPAQPPQLPDGIEITDARHIRIVGLAVRRNPAAGFAAILMRQPVDVHLEQLDVSGASVGIDIQNRMGAVSVRNSHIHDNTHAGIAVQRLAGAAPAPAGTRGRIEGNTVRANGGHGVDVIDTHWSVVGNRVADNGHAYGGTSAIHLFSRADTGGDCDDNEILYNRVSGQRDSSYYDGNGIQIDHFCDANRVQFNVVWHNAGAGISIVVGRDNLIANNTLYHNATDTARVRGNWSGRTEINLFSRARICINAAPDGNCTGGWTDVPPGRSGGNRVVGNVIVTARADVLGLYANDDFASPARHTNTLGPNLYGATGGVLVRHSDSRFLRSAGEIDAVLGGGNVVQPLVLRDAPQADTQPNALRPAGPIARGPQPADTHPDLDGIAPQDPRVQTWFGAWFAPQENR